MAEQIEHLNYRDSIINILIVGVGGQGVMTTGKFFHHYGALDPKISNFTSIESRGVSQREGSVKSIIRYIMNSKYEKIPFSPTLLPQSVHLLIAFEPLELFRYIHLLRSDAVVFLNSQSLIPKSCFIEKTIAYPDISQKMAQFHQIFPNVQLYSKNYHQLALEKFQASVKSNLLILEDIINTKSKISPIFQRDLYEQLLNQLLK